MELTERRIKEGEYFINSESTLKEVASEFGVSLGTVAYDFKKLKEIDKELYEAVKDQVSDVMHTFNYPYTIPQALLAEKICTTIGMDNLSKIITKR